MLCSDTASKDNSLFCLILSEETAWFHQKVHAPSASCVSRCAHLPACPDGLRSMMDRGTCGSDDSFPHIIRPRSHDPRDCHSASVDNGNADGYGCMIAWYRMYPPETDLTS